MVFHTPVHFFWVVIMVIRCMKGDTCGSGPGSSPGGLDDSIFTRCDLLFFSGIKIHIIRSMYCERNIMFFGQISDVFSCSFAHPHATHKLNLHMPKSKFSQLLHSI